MYTVYVNFELKTEIIEDVRVQSILKAIDDLGYDLKCTVVRKNVNIDSSTEEM